METRLVFTKSSIAVEEPARGWALRKTMLADSVSNGSQTAVALPPARTAWFFVVIYLLCLAAILVSRLKGVLPPIWLADAVIVHALLRHPLRTWPMLLSIGGIADAAAAASIGDSLVQAVALPLCNLAECMIVALPLSLLRFNEDFALCSLSMLLPPSHRSSLPCVVGCFFASSSDGRCCKRRRHGSVQPYSVSTSLYHR